VFIKELKENDDLLFTILIILNFERYGFDAKLPICSKNCGLYKRKSKIKSHAVSVLRALMDIKDEYGATSIYEFLKKEDTYALANLWIQRAKKFQRSVGHKFSKLFDENNLISFIEFYKSGRNGILRENVIRGKFKEAYDSISSIKGMGPKTAKFALRELAFSLTKWGRDAQVNYSTHGLSATTLRYALPITIWVRRISMAIPMISNRVGSHLTPKNMKQEDEDLSKTIAEICYSMGLNPLRFDFAAYTVGRKIGNGPDDYIYVSLQKMFQ